MGYLSYTGCIVLLTNSAITGREPSFDLRAALATRMHAGGNDYPGLAVHTALMGVYYALPVGTAKG